VGVSGKAKRNASMECESWALT
jgi:hypothetical protein